jgi:hypothetical protein
MHAAYVAVPHRGIFEAPIPLHSLGQIKFPSQALEKIILEKCFLGTEAAATLIAVTDATEDLRQSIDLRNALVNDFQKNPPASHLLIMERYLGLRTADGRRDERIRDNVAALYAQTDDCIFLRDG